MPTDVRRVTDEAGVEFTLGPEIARGAQGEVYRVEGQPDLAIKLVRRAEDMVRLASVRRLPLDGLHVAAPLSLIRDGGNGYVMRLASDMTPIREPYLPRTFGDRTSTPAWYTETGGLRRRLAIAAHLAEGIAGLHQRGLAYVDLNPNNVMVSDDMSRHETWLIDTDNLTSRSSPSWEVLGFPGYAAPERVNRRSPPSTLADAYILAVHVFRMLVLRHPLEGTAADALDGDDAQRRIDQGELPFVADPGDSSNALPPRRFSTMLLDIALSSRMKALAERTFTVGRLDPTRRPGSARWRDVLYSAYDNVIECPSGCGWTYFRLRPTCPRCNARTSAAVLLTVSPAIDGFALPARDSLVVDRERRTVLLPRHLWGRYDQPDPVVTLRPTPRAIDLVAEEGVRVLDRQGKDVARLPWPGGDRVWRVRVAAEGRPPRIVSLRSAAPA